MGTTYVYIFVLSPLFKIPALQASYIIGRSLYSSIASVPSIPQFDEHWIRLIDLINAVLRPVL
ncbi:hypothetical protein GALMADRAFT_256306 [Galerina marginata CBS 339.88]|uniref:Uncharacterized protein n=1 Tax=Galerina marginata (strain CBS 339.88) TaxID=685588 RepID=A0A067SDW2_GALM3|nr:hypothetical protein GALMADRAFT_256306 [Galerina marginata CBS 339.88]